MSESEYLEARRDASTLLDYLDDIQQGYHDLVAPHAEPLEPEGFDCGEVIEDEDLEYVPSANAAELAEYVSTHAVGLKEKLMEVQHDQRIASIIQSEYLLQVRLNSILQFWQWLRDANMLDDLIDEDPPHKEAVTCLPPEPGNEITGESVLAYVRDLVSWLSQASFELWGADRNVILALPKIGDRFLIGDFNQASQLSHTLSEGVALRQQWIKLAELGNYWDTVGVGSARAKLLFKGREILRSVIEPDRNTLGGGMFGNLFGSILGP